MNIKLILRFWSAILIALLFSPDTTSAQSITIANPNWNITLTDFGYSDFLLDNTLGAWHAGKVLAVKPALAETAQSEDELRNAVALPGCPWKCLRFIKT